MIKKNEIPWWFRSKRMNSDNAIWCLYTYSAVINGYSINNELAVRPAFVIDLSEVDFNINE